MPDIFYNPEEKREREDTDNADAADWHKGQYGHGQPEPCSFSFSHEAMQQHSERRERAAALYHRHLKHLKNKAKGIEKCTQPKQ